ncbi:hypothetical protein, partial [Micromonospora sp. b486]|uniref:hypothetical protein n=1 Tax=Micromonospora sp. b486 TaxID=3053986 RepID=UPI00259CCEC7
MSAFPLGDEVEVFDLETLEKAGSVAEQRNPATTLRFARGDRDLVVVYSDGSVACHDTATLQPRFRVAGALPRDEGTTTLDLSGDLLTVGFGYGLAAVWSLEAAACVATVRTGRGTIGGVTADEESRLIAVHLRTGDTNTVEVRSMDTGKAVRTFPHVDAHTEIRFASGVLLMAGMTRLTAWRPGDRRPRYELQWVKLTSSATLSFTAAVALPPSPVSRVSSSGTRRRRPGVRREGRRRSRPPRLRDRQRGGVRRRNVRRRGRPGEQTVDVWDLRTGRRIRTLHGHLAWVNAVRADR